MYCIGLDVYKRAISYCVKDGSGAIHAHGHESELMRGCLIQPQKTTPAKIMTSKAFGSIATSH